MDFFLADSKTLNPHLQGSQAGASQGCRQGQGGDSGRGKVGTQAGVDSLEECILAVEEREE